MEIRKCLTYNSRQIADNMMRNAAAGSYKERWTTKMERRNAWLSYKEAEETEMEKLAKAYREFLDKGKTETGNVLQKS